MRRLFGILGAVALIIAAEAANAAPMARSADLQATVAVEGVSAIDLVVDDVVVMVDDANGTLQLAAGVLQLTTPVVVPVTATTAIAQISATVVSNVAGTFSLGGAASQAPAEICATGMPAPGEACVVGGGLGGVMGLEGIVNIVIGQNVTIPVFLDDARIGRGGSTSVPFDFDAAAWTTGTGVIGVNAAGTTTFLSIQGANAGTGLGDSITLVTPTFVSAIGQLLPVFTQLKITFTDAGPVPAPGPLLLLGSAIAGLAGLGRQRKRARHPKRA